MRPCDVRIALNPAITAEQLWDFYVRNDICEAGYGDKAVTIAPFAHTPVVVGAFCGDLLVGVARALTDRSQAFIAEFCLELELQGPNEHENGSLVQSDRYGIAKRMADLMLDALYGMGVDFVTGYIVESIEEAVYESFGMTHNEGHKVCVIDKRPYVSEGT